MMIDDRDVIMLHDGPFG